MNLKQFWSTRSALFKLVCFGILFVIVFASVTSTRSCMSRLNDSRFDRQEEKHTEEINQKIAEAEQAREEKRVAQVEAEKWKAVAAAQDSIIASANERIRANEKQLEKIIADFESDRARIAGMSPDEVSAELRARLAKAGFKIE